VTIISQPSGALIDTIEAFVYDSVIAIDQVCQSLEDKVYDTASIARDPTIESEKRSFLAGRGDLVKVAILQVSTDYLDISRSGLTNT
jgi:hypothetical protein